jgi:hypothetical protein
VSIWYRTSEGCPSGDDFVQRLADLGRAAHLADAGDHIDFVVTLGVGTPKSSGRLERQTTGGTVAIRDVEAENCSQVSEALALSLDLALGPHDGDAQAETGSRPQIALSKAARTTSRKARTGSVTSTRRRDSATSFWSIPARRVASIC